MKQRAAKSKGGPPPSVFHSFPNGLGEFVDALVKAVRDLGADVRTETRIVRVEKIATDAAKQGNSARYKVHIAGPSGLETLECDAAILGMQGYAIADVIREVDDEMARDLGEVPYVSSAVVGLAYTRSSVNHALNATGIITTDKSDQPIMAVTFLSSKWAGRAPDDAALFRVFMGGAGREDMLSVPDAELIRIAASELQKLVGTSGEPTLARVYRHERASAQPVLGHDARVARVRAKEKAHPGLFVVGAAMDGVGIPDCVRQATDLAKRVLAD
ncbi:MAG: protoporphyrinogen oxidase [Polyangiaceae bacterium]|nr:protoporphyrinogen oxidase [Polyangiaceae bacterium]